MNIELNQKQLTHIILALEAYAKQLEQDEEDPGPSMSDAMYVANLAKTLREKHEAGERNGASTNMGAGSLVKTAENSGGHSQRSV